MTAKLQALLLLLSTVLVTGCDNGDKVSVAATGTSDSLTSQSATVGESAGAVNARVPVVPVRDLIINPTEPGWELTSVNQIIATENDMIYALDSYGQSVRVFGPSGELLRRLGRKGAGPGEFTDANEMSLMNDSLFVFESFNNRVTAFPLTGGVPHTRMVRLSGTTSSSIRARTNNGYLFTTSNIADLVPSFAVVSALSTGATQAVLVDHLPVPPVLKFDLTIENVKRSKYGITYAPQPLVQVPKTAPYPDGSGMLLATLHTNSGLSGARIQLVRVTLQGDTIWSRSLSIELSLVSDEQVIQLVDYLAAPHMFKGVTSIGDKLMISDSLHRERFWPPVRDLRIGLDNSIWITIGGPPWEPVQYWRLSSTGELNTVVELPAEFRLLWANREYVWGTRTNENFELTIERYRVQH